MTKRGIIILFISVAIVAGVGGWLSAELLADKIKRGRLADRLGEIQLAVERYAVDHEGDYPETLDELLASGALEAMPENPYTKQPMPLLAPEDAPVPGGVVYLAWGAQVIPPVQGNNSAEPPSELPAYTPQIKPDSYALVVYSDGPVEECEAPQIGGPIQEKLQAIKWTDVAVYLGTPAAKPLN